MALPAVRARHDRVVCVSCRGLSGSDDRVRRGPGLWVRIAACRRAGRVTPGRGRNVETEANRRGAYGKEQAGSLLCLFGEDGDREDGVLCRSEG